MCYIEILSEKNNEITCMCIQKKNDALEKGENVDVA